MLRARAQASSAPEIRSSWLHLPHPEIAGEVRQRLQDRRCCQNEQRATDDFHPGVLLMTRAARRPRRIIEGVAVRTVSAGGVPSLSADGETGDSSPPHRRGA